ncbi:MAG: DUF1080 domain-containing protein [Pirellulaceae bacterium]
MRHQIGLFVIATVIAANVSIQFVSAQENNQPPAGFHALFNGKDLEGWHGVPNSTQDPRKLEAMSESDRQAALAKEAEGVAQHWSVQNGDLVNDGHGPFLSTDEKFEDYEFWLDYKTVANADSGIYLKGTPQVQIWDYTEEGGKWSIGADKGSGGLWNNSAGAAGKDPSELADKPFGEWNRFKIQQIGARTSVWLNGKHVVDHATLENYFDRSSPLFRSGAIYLQTHGGEIRWKNIFARNIGSEEANQILASHHNDGFESIFNGKDFTGWKGPIDNYEIVDGTLRCIAGKGGTIYTDEEYGDFAVRLEFKLPPAGNNGLAIRYPGSGDTAYTGMCELQVLDAGYPGKLDPRQVHGSAYGMIPAKTGYLRPTGEWNFQEVTVVGSKIKVELNGYVILDGDLSEVTEYMGKSAHPGKDNKTGHFGFAGHSDPVEFRNISIKRLD